MSFKISKILQCILLIALASIFACSTDVDDATNNIADDHVKIGILAPLTGPLAGFGRDMENTARMAADEINRVGGVNGKPISFLVRDTRLGRSDSQTASLAMTNELINEGVVAIIGPAGSGTTLNIAPLAIANGVLLITPSATSPAISEIDDSDLIWRTVASDAFQGVFLAEQLVADGKNNIAVIYREDAYGIGLENSLVSAFQESGGTVLSSVGYPASKENNFESEVESIFSQGTPDAIVIISFVIDGANIMVSLANSSRTSVPDLYGVDGNNRDEFLENSPRQLVLGMKGSAPTAPSTAPNYIAFSERFENAFNAAPSVFTESTYDAVYLLASAMSVGRQNSTSALVQNLRPISLANTTSPLRINVGPEGYQQLLSNLDVDIDMVGAASEIDFDNRGDVTSGNYIFWEVVEVDGQLTFRTIRESSFP